MSKPDEPNSRRKFLISIGAGGAATAAAVVAAVAPEPEVAPTSRANPPKAAIRSPSTLTSTTAPRGSRGRRHVADQKIHKCGAFLLHVVRVGLPQLSARQSTDAPFSNGQD